MKKFCLTAVIAALFLFISNGMQAQTTQMKLDQLKLMEQFLGTWQLNEGKDTFLVAEIEQYGKAFVEHAYLNINGKESQQMGMFSYSFSSKEGKFKVFELMANGSYLTMLASFTTEKKFCADIVQDFNPEKVLMKMEFVFETPSNMTVIPFSLDGVKRGEYKYTKVK
jgi:hypothetical protein